MDVHTVYERVQQMRDAVPMVWWKALCYHFVRKSRQVTRYRSGDTVTYTQHYQERIITHSATGAFDFSSCGVKDVSKRLVDLEKFAAVKMKFSKGFSFVSERSELEFDHQRAHFFNDNQLFDVYMDTQEGLELTNTCFNRYVIAFCDPRNLPWYLSQLAFWIFSIFLLSWPLRVLIEYKTAHVRYHVHKIFGVNHLPTARQPSVTVNPIVAAEEFRSAISRDSTINSFDLDLKIRENFYQVPSYSEAILMDSVQPEEGAASFILRQNSAENCEISELREGESADRENEPLLRRVGSTRVSRDSRANLSTSHSLHALRKPTQRRSRSTASFRRISGYFRRYGDRNHRASDRTSSTEAEDVVLRNTQS